MIRRSVTALALCAAAAASPAAAQPAGVPVVIRFAATAGRAPVACGQRITDIGTTRSTISLVDFRFYVSRVRLVTATGAEVPLTLAQDGLWQHDDVALLDFEDATGPCANGTPETRAVVEGTAPAGDYSGVRFDVGLPFEKNHQDVTLQPSPLNLSRMFWNWNAGYKFMRLDLRSSGQPRGWLVHLGSTACKPEGTPSVAAIACANRNVVGVDLPTFSATRDIVDLDVRALFATSNVDMNTAETALGCMSGSADPECAGLFGQLGLAIGERPAAPQQVFRAVPAMRSAQ